MLSGIPATVFGLLVYHAAVEAEESVDQIAAEHGLTEIPGVSLEYPKAMGTFIAAFGGLMMVAGAVFLLIGLMKRVDGAMTESTATIHTRYCQYCGSGICTEAVRCPGCGRAIGP